MAIVFKSATAIGFCTDPLTGPGGGYRWTLVTKLGDYLREAERRYGRRNMEWTILGIEFHGEIPHLWYPGSDNYVSVMLTDAAATNPNEALFELAHEVVHLLEPTLVHPTTVLEEGLATLFAHDMSTRDGLNLSGSTASYQTAERAVKELLSIHPDGIREIRALTRRSFALLTSEEIIRACPGVPEPLAVQLSSKFNRDALA